MEVKINKEIRNYTESMFFGLSMRQFIFFCPCLRCGGGFVFSSPSLLWHGNIKLDVYFRSFAFCSVGFYQVQRDDSGAVRLGVDKIRVYHAEKAVVFPR